MLDPACVELRVSMMGGEGDGTLRSGTEKGVECWKHRFASFETVLNYVQKCMAGERNQAHAFQIWKLELEEVIKYFTPR